MQCRIPRSDIPDVALEMLHIHGVEADDGRIEAHVRFGDMGTEVVWRSMFSKVGFSSIERGEEGFDRFSVGFLCPVAGFSILVESSQGNDEGSLRGEPRLVDTIVDVIVRPIIRSFDFFPQILGKQVDFLIFFWNDVVKFCIKHAYDFA